MNKLKQLILITLSISLVIASMPPVLAGEFLAVPGEREIGLPSVERGSPSGAEHKGTDTSSVSVIDMGLFKQISMSLVSEKLEFKDQGLDIISRMNILLQQNGFDKNCVVKQNIFLKDISQKEKCTKIFKIYYSDTLPATSFVNLPPINGDSISIELIALSGENVDIDRVDENITIVETGGIKWSFIAGVEPDEDIKDTYKQALNCWEKMNEILEENGFNFKQVIRTWIYEFDIFKDEEGGQRYQKLNKAREDFFKRVGLVKDDSIEQEKFPASTGIGMSSGNFIMECIALTTDRKDVSIIPLENPEQVSAFRYTERVLGAGAPRPLFSRGMAIQIRNKKKILVSGTASILKEDTEHDIIVQQTDTTIDNVLRVLGQGGAGVKDIIQLRVYVKDVKNYEYVKTIEKRFPSVPCLYLLADVCREDLLVEIEAEAYVSLSEQPVESDQLVEDGGNRYILIAH